MKKKLFIIAQNYYPEIGSAANRMKNIAELINEEGDIEVSVLTLKPRYPNNRLYKENQDYVASSNVKIFYVSSFFKKYHKNLFLRLLFYIDISIRFFWKSIFLCEKKSEILVSIPSIFIGINGVLLKKIKKSTLILDIRDLWPNSLIGVERLTNPVLLRAAYCMEKLTYLKANKIIVNSRGFESYIKRMIPQAKIIYIPNSTTRRELAIGREKVSQLNGHSEQDLRLIYTGNIGLAQDLTYLLRIAEVCKRNNLPVKIKVIGFGVNRNEFINKCKSKKLTNIEYHRPMLRQQTIDELINADIAFVGLKHSEIFDDVLPGKIVDYFSFGLPVIADVSGVSASIIHVADAGINLRDTHDWETQVIRLLTDKDEIKRLQKNANDYAEEHFNWDKNINIFKSKLFESR